MKTFRGWVPTITGNLSFAIIGQGRTPKRAFKVSRASNGIRHVVVAQKRRTTDVPFRYVGDVLNLLLSRVGHTIYIFFGEARKSDEYKLLTGPCVELTPKEYRKIAGDLVPLGDQSLSEEEFKNQFILLAEKFSAQSSLPGCGLSSIHLNRNGQVEISFENSVTQKEGQDIASQIYFFYT